MRHHRVVFLFALGLLALPVAGDSFGAEKSPSGEGDKASTGRSASQADSEDAAASKEPAKDESQALKAREESIFQKLIVDPYERRYGRAPGDGWIPLLRTPTELRFGGFVQLNVIHDFEDTGFDFGDFIPSLIPVPEQNTPNMQFDVRASRVTFETRTNTKETGSVMTMISADFAENESQSSIQPRLRQAYVMWVGAHTNISYTAGQTWTTFMDLQVWPEVFDLEGPNAMTGLRQGLIRAGHTLGKTKRVVLDVSLEQPDTAVDGGVGLRDWPDLAARVNWQPTWGHLQGAAIGRRLVAEDPGGMGRDAAYGWGWSLSGSWMVPGTKLKDTPSDDLGARQDQIQFQAQAGSGIGRYVFDPSSAPTPQDAVYDPARDRLLPLDETGAFAAYHHWWSNRWRSELVYGVVRMDNPSIQPSSALHRTTYALGNVLWRPFRRMDVGLEYYLGSRENKDGQKGRARRIMFSVLYGF